MSYLGTNRSRAYQALTSDVVELEVRQHPQQGVVTPENKEKMRKPIDPPPIIELKVDPRRDTGSHFLVNPFLFMTANLVEVDPQENGEYVPIRPNPLIGTFSSSLHRLKDVNNRDGGFFVFGDISCRREGTFRLQFSLFEVCGDGSSAVYSVCSNPFRVMPLKEFKGLQESTHLSRTFSDQGVRLRLRKEPRTLNGSKRTWDASADSNTSSQYHQNAYGMQPDQHSYPYATTSNKRQRSDSDVASHGYQHGAMMGGPVVPYSNGGGTNSYGGSYATNPYQTSQYMPQPSQGSMVNPLSQHGSTSLWQRSYPQGPYSASYSAPFDSSSVHAYSSSPVSGAPPSSSIGDLYAAPRTHQYHARLPSDPFTAGYGLATPTSGSDNGMLGGQQHSNQSQQSPGITRHGASDSVSIGHSQPSLTGQYLMTNSTLPPSLSSYSQAPQAFSTLYQQTPTQTMGKYDSTQYGSSSRYHDSVQDPYATDSITDTTLSLNTSLITRGYAPASHPPQPQGNLGSYQDDDLTALKPQPQAYPTPHHASPLS